MNEIKGSPLTIAHFVDSITKAIGIKDCFLGPNCELVKQDPHLSDAALALAIETVFNRIVTSQECKYQELIEFQAAVKCYSWLLLYKDPSRFLKFLDKPENTENVFGNSDINPEFAILIRKVSEACRAKIFQSNYKKYLYRTRKELEPHTPMSAREIVRIQNILSYMCLDNLSFRKGKKANFYEICSKAAVDQLLGYDLSTKMLSQRSTGDNETKKIEKLSQEEIASVCSLMELDFGSVLILTQFLNLLEQESETRVVFRQISPWEQLEVCQILHELILFLNNTLASTDNKDISKIRDRLQHQFNVFYEVLCFNTVVYNTKFRSTADQVSIDLLTFLTRLCVLRQTDETLEDPQANSAAFKIQVKENVTELLIKYPPMESDSLPKLFNNIQYIGQDRSKLFEKVQEITKYSSRTPYRFFFPYVSDPLQERYLSLYQDPILAEKFFLASQAEDWTPTDLWAQDLERYINLSEMIECISLHLDYNYCEQDARSLYEILRSKIFVAEPPRDLRLAYVKAKKPSYEDLGQTQFPESLDSSFQLKTAQVKIETKETSQKEEDSFIAEIRKNEARKKEKMAELEKAKQEKSREAKKRQEEIASSLASTSVSERSKKKGKSKEGKSPEETSEVKSAVMPQEGVQKGQDEIVSSSVTSTSMSEGSKKKGKSKEVNPIEESSKTAPEAPKAAQIPYELHPRVAVYYTDPDAAMEEEARFRTLSEDVKRKVRVFKTPPLQVLQFLESHGIESTWGKDKKRHVSVPCEIAIQGIGKFKGIISCCFLKTGELYHFCVTTEKAPDALVGEMLKKGFWEVEHPDLETSREKSVKVASPVIADDGSFIAEQVNHYTILIKDPKNLAEFRIFNMLNFFK